MLRKEMVTGIALALLLIAAAPALAQDADPPEARASEEPQQLEAVVVTGSRIQQVNLFSSSPVIQVEAEDLAFQGTVRVEDMLRNLPQLYSTQNASQSNGATGTATLNLRNLGAERTLVLVNGRRLPAGSPLQGGVGADINQIPAALIESVEVLTGGSSATYGSDAIAGVVNFLMRDDFEGIKLDYQFSQYQNDNGSDRWQRIVRDAGYEVADGSTWDGDISNVSLIAGHNLGQDRGNVTVYGTYRDIDPVLQGDRDYSSCALSNDLSECSGSATQPHGTFADFGVLRSQGLDSFDYKVEGGPLRAPRGNSVQLRAVELFSASRPTLDRRPVCPLRPPRPGRDLRRVHVHGQSFGSPDRPLGCLLCDQHPELRQRLPVPAAV